ncbi:TRAM domain-containing protein [Halorubrum sp. JWXQ-INN 858]|uniref:TRAM domain-containing protein n=1 Tax=Halorubrum sp. JWXQ-INN 858 TaxID=2690782 RepID=UPI0013576018|nr:TRAM domain-containing protein [Halorubrum sp. JWXQ-INN 858]MWV64361.1 TRAM domain-containing protein [Halorubrum sp. JWXQ-INN 858]
MVEITESLSCLYTGSIERNADGEYVVRVPSREVEHGTVDLGGTYRVALIARDDAGSTSEGSPLKGSTSGGSTSGGSRATGRTTAAGADGNDAATNGNRGSGGARSRTASSGPPVSEGDVRDVTIETLGDKGDGIAKIERGYVVIVPDSELGDEVTVEITSVRDNVSFATVLDE